MDAQARRDAKPKAEQDVPSGLRFYLFASPQLALATLGQGVDVNPLPIRESHGPARPHTHRLWRLLFSHLLS